MTSSVPPLPAVVPPDPGGTSPGPPGGEEEPARVSRSRRPYRGRAQAFRREQEELRRARRELLGNIVVVLIIGLGVYAILTARPFNPASVYTPPPTNPPISVKLGTPNVSAVTCAAGAPAFAERIVWLNSSEPVRTGDVDVRVYEIWDNDWITDPNVVANATPTSVCAGPAPFSVTDWYVVLSAPNGTNLLYYTDGSGWVSVSGAPWNIEITDGSSFVVVTDPAIAQTGRGFAVYGYENGSLIEATTPL